ncbi:hypothetical protein LINPERHAP1_LOCUS21736 [Linum perenne]
MFRPLPSCVCNPLCSCDALIRVRGYFQSEQIIRFLRGLNPRFATVRSKIFRTEPLPTINQVFSMVSQEQQELGASTVPSSGADSSQVLVADSAPHVLVAGPQYTGFKRGTKRSVCTFCGLIGHIVEK